MPYGILVRPLVGANNNGHSSVEKNLWEWIRMMIMTMMTALWAYCYWKKKQVHNVFFVCLFFCSNIQKAAICLLLHLATLPSQSVGPAFSCPLAKTKCSKCCLFFCHWTGDVFRAVCRLTVYISVNLWLNVRCPRCLSSICRKVDGETNTTEPRLIYL